MIKHNSAASVISSFNPIVTLNSSMRSKVNSGFIQPILEHFFSNEGIENYKELDSDKIKTEIEFKDFKAKESFVKSYVYKELMNDITKSESGEVLFKQRYVISFDEDLTAYSGYERGNLRYPYQAIFEEPRKRETKLRYGVIRLGKIPILYIIYIELQEMIRYIKTLPQEIISTEHEKASETPEHRRNNILDQLIGEQYRKIEISEETEKEEMLNNLLRLQKLRNEKLVGESGSLRVNLSWNTTDDLDLHVMTTSGKEIHYNNKVLEYNGSIAKLDVDANAGDTYISNPQENINWDIIPEGKHTISVDFYKDREKKGKVPFSVFIDNGLDSRLYESFVESSGINKTRKVVEFEFQDGQIKFNEEIN